MRACSVLGQITYFGWGVTKDVEKAKTLWTKACCYRPTSSMSHRAGCVMAITGMEPGCHAV